MLYPAGSDGARSVLRVRMTQQITLPDNFVLRPEEYAAVAVDSSESTIYVGSRDGTLLALDSASGGVRWEFHLDGAVSSQPVLATVAGQDGDVHLLLVGTDNGEMVAIDRRTHKERWRYQTDGKIRNPPVVHEGVVYLVNSRDQVFALDLRMGQWRWQYEQKLQTDFTVAGRAGLTFVPHIGDTAGETGTVYTCFDNGKVAALGSSSGEALWLASVAPPNGRDFIDCDSTPLWDAAGEQVIVAGQSTGVFALAAADGAERWGYPIRATTSLVHGRGRDVFGASSLEGVFALDATGHQIWRTKVDKGVLSAPVVVDDTVFVTHSDSGLLAFDADTGEFLAQLDLGSGMSSVPVFDRVSAQFYATTNRGLLVGLEVVDAAPPPIETALR